MTETSQNCATTNVNHVSLKQILTHMGVKETASEMLNVPIAGRASNFLHNWNVVTQDHWVLKAIQGVEIDFFSQPHQIVKPRPPYLSEVEMGLVKKEIEEMMSKGAVQRLHPKEAQSGFFSNIFLVPKKDGRMRPVINLKALNQYVQPQHFKMEGMQNLRDLLRQNDWMTKLDLKDAYFTIPIHSNHRQHLRFSVEEQSFQFTCLPFGLSSAPWIFIKILKPVAALLREHGVRLIVYIDDMLIMSESIDLAKEHTAALTYLLENLGFLLSEKSVSKPAQEMDFLGMVVDSVAMRLKIPGGKMKKIRQEARGLLNPTAVSAREVSRIIGKMTAMSQGIPPAPLFYRCLQRDLSRALERGQQSYETACPLSHGAREELQWWITYLERWNGKSLLVHQPELTIESDASLRGWGAASRDVQTGGPWSPEEKQYHINCLEILAAFLAIKTFMKNRTDTTILILIDNTTAVAYINNLGGTVSPRATEIAKELWMWCLERNITVKAQYLPGVENVRADMESRIMPDRSDWMLNRQIFQRIQNRMGPVGIDLFASRLTFQLPRYFSWRPDPMALATDALLQEWEGLKAYANPPWNLVGRTLGKAQREKVELILLIAPVWPTQPWYPNLLDLLVDYPRLIPQWENALLGTAESAIPEIIPQLAVWPISNRDTRKKAFQQELVTPPGIMAVQVIKVI